MSQAMLQNVFGPVRGDLAPLRQVAEDPASKLKRALAELKAQAILPLLSAALSELDQERHQQAGELAMKALELDDQCGLVWHVLAICREKVGDFQASLRCYETALRLDPDDVDLANDLGRLAYQMGMKEVAEQLFRKFLADRPDSSDGLNNLACALRDQMRYADAYDVLRPAIEANPAYALLWNTVGTVVTEQGDVDKAIVFYDEALRLDPAFAKARYNRANGRLALGDARGALADCDEALTTIALERERVMMQFARSTMLLASGKAGEGWDAYEVRLDPHYADVTHFALDRPMWTPDTSLEGARLLLVGEQGLGDEVLFANVVPDVLKTLGPYGQLTLAVEPRLVSLFQRSFPQATVERHATVKVDHHCVRCIPALKDQSQIDLWAPLGSLLRRFRRKVGDFPPHPAFLTADPQRVAYWRGVLDALGPGRRVGLVWKSFKINSARSRFFSPFDAWAPILRTPGVRFVNLQYGDSAPELQRARDDLGVDIWTPPGIDLKDELDDVAALCCALDLVIGPANATTNLAAACGAPTWIIAMPGAWTLLGAERYPWYPRARVFSPPAFNRWEPVMQAIAGALATG